MKTHSVKDFLNYAFKCLDLNYEDYLITDKKFFRPAEVDLLISDSSKAKKDLNWSIKTSFHELVELMVKSDYDFFKKNK